MQNAYCKELRIRGPFTSFAQGRRGDLTKTIVRVMQLTAIFLLGFTITLSAHTHSQTISFSGKNVSLQKAFEAIETQTRFFIVANNQLVEQAGNISIEANNQPLGKFLESVLENKSLAYTIKGTNILITYKPDRPAPSFSVSSSDLPPVTGIVRDKDGHPLAGVNIVVKGTKTGTVTDANGRFSIATIAGNTLVISSIGYVAREVNVGYDETINIILGKSESKLDEVQIIAYGTTSRRLNTGNTATVTAEDIEKQPVQNPLLALQGRVPGLTITQNSGLAGGGVTIRLQGQNSINPDNGNDPLIVIDGVPYSSQMLLTTTGGFSGGLLNGSGGSSYAGGGNPLNYINPNTIESIQVLKDADATAIYGSRAANGAILITTKTGKAGTLKTDINIQQGWSKIGRFMDLMNTDQYLTMRKEAFANDNIPVPSIITDPTNTDYDVNGLWDQERSTDWQKELIGNTVHSISATASLSGGSEGTQYLVSSNYYRQTTIFPGSFNDKKGSIHVNLNTSSSNKKFRAKFSVDFLSDNNQLPASGFLIGLSSIYLAPNAPAIYNEDGTLNWQPAPSGAASWVNPIATLNNTYQNKTKNLIGSANLGYTILPGLTISSNFGYNNLQADEMGINPSTAADPSTRTYFFRTALYTNSTIYTWIVEPQLSYKKVWGSSKLEVLLGGTVQQTKNNGESYFGFGYSSDQLMKNKGSATTLFPSTLISEYKYAAAFGRVNYNWKDKYIANLTARRDGSSRFGPESRFHNFGAVGLAWIFSEEEAIKNNFSFLSFGKLRGSYGTTGNDQIPDYQYMSLLADYFASLPYQNTSGLAIQGLTNPYLQWEETKKLQVGIDLGFIKDRILTTVNYVHNRSDNQLLPYSLPGFVGFGSIISNFPAQVENTAWEFSLSTINVQSKKVKWSTNFNLTIPKNKLAAFPDLESSTYNSQLIIGQPLNIARNFSLSGVDPSTGLYQFINAKGELTNSPVRPDDEYVLVNISPRYYGGFENTVQYNGFQLDVSFQFVKQYTDANLTTKYAPGRFISGVNNQPVSALDRWQKSGDIAAVQKFSTTSELATITDKAIGSNVNDASFVRLKNVSLSWQFPDRWKGKLAMQSARLFVQGQNLLTITHYKGFDPENGSAGIPPLRIITTGIQITL